MNNYSDIEADYPKTHKEIFVDLVMKYEELLWDEKEEDSFNAGDLEEFINLGLKEIYEHDHVEHFLYRISKYNALKDVEAYYKKNFDAIKDPANKESRENMRWFLNSAI